MKRTLSISALLALMLVVVPASFSQNAASLYKTKCQACHGADGKAKVPVAAALGVRDFTSPAVAKESEAEMIAITSKGKNKMPSYAGKLTDDQIKQLVKYIRTLK